ncbi:MAG: internal scaffolding protein [Microvirus sp.]|nr:MAG: internal scaffolding protein [Microvirus sp.]
MSKIFLRTAYNHDVDEFSNLFGIGDFGPSLTVQSDKDDCDINLIMERFGRGIPVPVNVKSPMQGDFTGVTDYQSSLNLIIEAQSAFMEMPANVRARFENDPGHFLDFISDPANQDEAIRLGLAIDNRQQPSALPKDDGDLTSEAR